MRPLLVLVVVLAAVAVFLATMLRRGDNRSPVTIAPPALEQPATFPSKACLDSPEVARQAPGPDRRQLSP